MKKIGLLEFPETPEEARHWLPDTRWFALHQFVLCAATSRIDGTWAAYCRNVPGYNHIHEYKEVLATGDQLPEKLARSMFPIFDSVEYAK